MPTQLSQLLRADGAEAIHEALDADGGVIITDFLSPETLGQFDHHANTVSDVASVQKFWGANTKRFTRLAHRSEAFIDILTDPLYLSVADAVLLPNAVDYWMNTGQMMIIGPGERAQVLHRDADNWPTMNTPTGFEVTLSCMFAISDFTAPVGATRVVPGSHRWEDYERRATPDEVTQAVMPAGAAMMYTGRVLHSGGANQTTDQWRSGLHLSYVLGWLTPEEAGPLGTSWEEVRHLPTSAQRLLGWRCAPAKHDAARLWTVDYEDVPVGLGYLSDSPDAEPLIG
jgi:ectoine hydroxylase-related dioxygenase (phytanoyl-CoA dioxygenase family)